MAARLGRYEVLKHLASGGMADVLLGRTDGIEGFERHVVLKRIKPEHAQDLRFIRMFLDEARLAANLHHQHIVQVHDIGEAGGEYFIAMEYLHGEDVRTILLTAARSRQHVPLGYAMAIVSASAAGLHYAHERRGPDKQPLGIVHRDVSPSNILVCYDGSIKIVDFGIAKASARQETRSSNLKGKIAYMSPEQCKSAEIDRRSDVYSLGIVLYELSTTTRLFKGTNDYLVMDQIVNGRVPPPQARRPDLPAELSAIIMRAIAPDPERRFPTADELRRAIDQVAEKLGLTASSSAIAAYMHQQFGEKPEPWLERSAPHLVPLAGLASAAPQPGGGWTELWRSDSLPSASGPSRGSGTPLGSGLVPRASGPIGTGVGNAGPRSPDGPRDAARGGVNRPAVPAERGRESPLLIDEPRDAARGVGNRPAVPGERGRESPLLINESRDAARGGVNRPAVPRERGPESPLLIDEPRDAARGGGKPPPVPGERGRESPVPIDALSDAMRGGGKPPAVPGERGRESPLLIEPRDAARGGGKPPAVPGERGRESPLLIEPRDAARGGGKPPAVPGERGRESPLLIEPRDAARGGGKPPAVPGERGRESPVPIDALSDAMRGGGKPPAVPGERGRESPVPIDALSDAMRGGMDRPAMSAEGGWESPPWLDELSDATRRAVGGTARDGTGDVTRRGVNRAALAGERGQESALPIDTLSDAARGEVNRPAVPAEEGRESSLWLDEPDVPTEADTRPTAAPTDAGMDWESQWSERPSISDRPNMIAAAIAVPLFVAIAIGIWWFARTDALPARSIPVKPVAAIPPIEEVTKLAVPAPVDEPVAAPLVQEPPNPGYRASPPAPNRLAAHPTAAASAASSAPAPAPAAPGQAGRSAATPPLGGATSPRVGDAAPVVLSHAAIERVASQHGRELSKCDAGALHGDVTVRFSVDPAGKVSQVELVTTMRKPTVAACLLRTVHAWQFPPQAEPAVGTYTLSFR